MKLSYVIVTHNRLQSLLKTIAILYKTTPLPDEEWEIWVVDNASTDGTVTAVELGYPDVRIIKNKKNEGAPARNEAFSFARGEYCILLDDDSYPIKDCVSRSIEYLDTHLDSAAVVGQVILPDGSLEACAFPSIILSGAVCIRTDVLRNTGGFRKEFFRKAGEYDLSFRIMQAGYNIERFEDIEYRHDKVLTGRSSSLAHKLDIRNNLILVERFLPQNMRSAYRHDWLRRYAMIADSAGQVDAITSAVEEVRLWAAKERNEGRTVLGNEVLETVFQWNRQAQLVEEWVNYHNIRNIVIADYGKNIYATYRAARLTELTIHSIADDNPAMQGGNYRSITILPLREALKSKPDGVILSNINPAQIENKFNRIRSLFKGPILRLWHSQNISDVEWVSSSDNSVEVAG